MPLSLSVRPISTVAKTTSLANDDAGQLIGLAALAKAAFQGADLRPWRAHLLGRLAQNENDANALMDLATVLHLMGQRECGLSLQALALQIQRVYRLRSPGNHTDRKSTRLNSSHLGI